jgi:hypothetical protein
MPSEYEKAIEAKRKAEEYERQALAFKLSTPAPMGQINHYIEGMQMSGRLRGAGGTPSTDNYRDLQFGGKKNSDFETQDKAKAEFAAKYGGSPEDMLSGMEAFKSNPKASNPYTQFRSMATRRGEAEINALNYRGQPRPGAQDAAAAKEEQDNYNRLMQQAKLEADIIEKMPKDQTLDRYKAQLRLTAIKNQLNSYNKLPLEAEPAIPERPDSEYFSWGDSDPQNKYDKTWGKYLEQMKGGAKQAPAAAPVAPPKASAGPALSEEQKKIRIALGLSPDRK